MKKVLKLFAVAFMVAVCAVAFTACAKYKEVAGTYELTDIHGTVAGVTVTKDMYEYFEIELTAKGEGTVRSKGTAPGSVAYENHGEFTYEDGVIKMTTTSGGMSVTEEYKYEDGVITYEMDQGEFNFTVVLTRK